MHAGKVYQEFYGTIPVIIPEVDVMLHPHATAPQILKFKNIINSLGR
jgi:hypothetical protein